MSMARLCKNIELSLDIHGVICNDILTVYLAWVDVGSEVLLNDTHTRECLEFRWIIDIYIVVFQ